MIRPRAILAIARKDALDILLNKTTLFTLFSPILVSLLYLVFSSISNNAITVLLYDPGQSGLQQVVNSTFAKTKITSASSPNDVSSAFGPDGTRRDARYDVGLIVPDNFTQEVRTGQQPQISLYLNGSTINQQQTASLQAAITNYTRSIVTSRSPIRLIAATINPAPATLEQSLNAFFAALVLIISFMIGITILPDRLIEEKEKKTLRMLLVAPVSFGDVILGKLLVVLVYQVALSLIAVSIQRGWGGDLPLTLLYLLLGTCFSLSLGLLIGSIFQTSGAAGAASGIIFPIYLMSGLFVGPLLSVVNNPLLQVFKILPPYYLADGAYNAMQGLGSPGSHLLDISVLLGSTIVVLLFSTWLLRRQSAVVATI